MKRFVNDVEKNYSLAEFEAFPMRSQKRIAKTLSMTNRILLIGECKDRYNDCLNDSVPHYNLINKYANIYTLLLESAA